MAKGKPQPQTIVSVPTGQRCRICQSPDTFQWIEESLAKTKNEGYPRPSPEAVVSTMRQVFEGTEVYIPHANGLRAHFRRHESPVWSSWA